MKQDYVTFDTAMLSKDNDYTENTYTFYKINEEENTVHDGFSNNIFFKEVRISAPTQTVLQKWLRKKDIEVLVTRPYNSEGESFWSFEIYYNGWLVDSIKNKTEFKTYEESLEVGLRFGLNLIKTPIELLWNYQ